MNSQFNVQHRDWSESLTAAACAGGADFVLTSPPYPDARTGQYGVRDFDTTIEGYRSLGRAIFESLKPGGVCALNIDGPVRIWRPELGESERSTIALEVGLDWSRVVGFRYIEHCAYVRDGVPISGDGSNPRWRSGFELVHIFARPGGKPYFDRWGYTRKAVAEGRKSGGRHRRERGWGHHKACIQGDRRCLTSAERWTVNQATTDRDHPAMFDMESRT